MSKQVVLAVLASSDDAESLLNNLSEEGISERGISVIMCNETDARALADNRGPLADVTAGNLVSGLTKLGVSAGDIETYRRVVGAGGVLLALAMPSALSAAVSETLREYRAQHILTI